MPMDMPARGLTAVNPSAAAAAQPITGDHIPAIGKSTGCAHALVIACRTMTADVTIFAALIAGALSFLSPCVLPLVPPYLVYLTGTSLERLADQDATAARRD